ncbi:MAG TPA: EpsI family protein [Bryobacteraceae bacterium]|nr:EpsI family protein [Bryobacteraceae bacterium]
MVGLQTVLTSSGAEQHAKVSHSAKCRELRIAAFLFLLLGAHLVLNYTVEIDEVVVPPTALQTLPRQLGVWSLQGDGFLAPDVYEYLRPSDYIFRTYTDPHDVVGTVYVAYFASQRSGAYPHSPKHCLPGAGWHPLLSQTIDIAAGADMFPANEYLLRKGTSRAAVVYWYQTPFRTYAQELAGKLWMLPDLLLHKRSDLALARVMLVLTPEQSEEQARAKTKQLAGELYLSLKQHLTNAGLPSRASK